jgi:TRAP transporter TAXI family solute receptor
VGVGLVAVFATGLPSWGCAAGQAETPRRVVRIMTSNPTGDYYLLGEVLARVYNDSIAEVRATIEQPNSGALNVGAVEDGSAELAFASADGVYEAFVRGTHKKSVPHGRLRGIAVLFADALQIVVARNSTLKKTTDLRGARVGFTVTSPNTPVSTASRRFKLVELAMGVHGLSPQDITMVPGTPDELREAMLSRRIDAWFILAGYPISKISTLYPGEGVRLLEIGRKAALQIRAEAPFFKPVVIPAGTYPGQDTPVETIGSEHLLVCREDLDDELVYRLTKALFDGLPRLTDAHAVMSFVDPAFAAATPIPLHTGAAQYYRERQLLH